MAPDDLAKNVGMIDHEMGSESVNDPDHMAPSLPAAVLRAVAMMARISKRQQAELGVALQRAGLMLAPSHQAAAIRHLCETALIEDLIPLTDGGILLSVTSAGMERALR